MEVGAAAPDTPLSLRFRTAGEVLPQLLPLLLLYYSQESSDANVYES